MDTSAAALMDSLGVLETRVDSLTSAARVLALRIDNLGTMWNWQTGVFAGLAGVMVLLALFVVGYGLYDRRQYDRKLAVLRDQLDTKTKTLASGLSEAHDTLMGEIGRTMSFVAEEAGRPPMVALWAAWSALHLLKAGRPALARLMAERADKWTKADRAACVQTRENLIELEGAYSELTDDDKTAATRKTLRAVLDRLELERPQSGSESPGDKQGSTK